MCPTVTAVLVQARLIHMPMDAVAAPLGNACVLRHALRTGLRADDTAKPIRSHRGPLPPGPSTHYPDQRGSRPASSNLWWAQMHRAHSSLRRRSTLLHMFPIRVIGRQARSASRSIGSSSMSSPLSSWSTKGRGRAHARGGALWLWEHRSAWPWQEGPPALGAQMGLLSANTPVSKHRDMYKIWHVPGQGIIP